MKPLLILALCSQVLAGGDVLRIRASENLPDGAIQRGHSWCVAVGKHQVLTVYHFMPDAQGNHRQVEVRHDGAWLPAKLLKHDKEADLALFEVGAKLDPAQLWDENLTAVGAQALEESKTILAKATRVSLSLPVPADGSGLCGAGVFCSGELYAIVSSQEFHNGGRVSGRFGAIPVGVIREFLNGSGKR